MKGFSAARCPTTLLFWPKLKTSCSSTHSLTQSLTRVSDTVPVPAHSPSSVLLALALPLNSCVPRLSHSASAQSRLRKRPVSAAPLFLPRNASLLVGPSLLCLLVQLPRSSTSEPWSIVPCLRERKRRERHRQTDRRAHCTRAIPISSAKKERQDTVTCHQLLRNVLSGAEEGGWEH